MLNNYSPVYTCNVYLVLGTWSTLEDVNTLVDTGSDGSLLAEVEKIYTGVGKNGVDRVILTHSHFDHAGGLPTIVQKYRPEVYSFAQINMNDKPLSDGQLIRLGDGDFEVIHAPAHSHDSICLYCVKERVLFSGDTPLNIRSPGGSYARSFVDLLERLSRLEIDVIYSGHGEPARKRPAEMIRNTLINVKKSSVT
ncbi:MAG: MBL fold metallo-hydrolase [Nitrospirae bacterium]|nr:MBL fold metallo-hydrolase [Nitrospirota bacterium]